MVATISKILPQLEIHSTADLVDLTRKGLNVKFVSDVMIYTGMNNKELSNALPISERQLVRYTEGTLLKPEVTERLLRLLHIYDQGYDLFGDREAFQSWMRSPNWGLGQISPISLMDTSFGIDMVETVIVRLAHGVYS